MHLRRIHYLFQPSGEGAAPPAAPPRERLSFEDVVGLAARLTIK